MHWRMLRYYVAECSTALSRTAKQAGLARPALVCACGGKCSSCCDNVERDAGGHCSLCYNHGEWDAPARAAMWIHPVTHLAHPGRVRVGESARMATPCRSMLVRPTAMGTRQHRGCVFASARAAIPLLLYGRHSAAFIPITVTSNTFPGSTFTYHPKPSTSPFTTIHCLPNVVSKG